jgi:hypothetical protein
MGREKTKQETRSQSLLCTLLTEIPIRDSSGHDNVCEVNDELCCPEQVEENVCKGALHAIIPRVGEELHTKGKHR